MEILETKTELLEKVLSDLAKIGGIEFSAAISRDGLLIGSEGNKKQAEIFAAMSATMVGAAETATTELGKGIPKRVIAETDSGKIIAVGAGQKALLAVMTKPDALLGIILTEIQKAASKIKEILG